MQSIDLTYVIETRVDMQSGVCVGRHSVDEETRRCAARASPLRLICELVAKTGEGLVRVRSGQSVAQHQLRFGEREFGGTRRALV